MPAVHMEQVRNLRDIGGVPTRSGRRVIAGRLFRSASPHEMTEADRATFQRLAVGTIIDLRTHWERERQQYRSRDIEVLWIPLAAEDAVSSITERFMAGDLTSGELEDWWELIGIYTAPETQVDGIRAVFMAFLGVAPGEAVLFHCRGGKDRTGLVAALALEALGVDRALVIEDFLLSSDALDHGPTAEAAAMRVAMEMMGLTSGALRSLSGVQAEWLITLLDGLDSRYGSVDTYLSDRVGLGTDGLERLRRIYLEPMGA